MRNHQPNIIKTTVELPEDLIYKAKISAFKQKTSFKNILTNSLRAYLNQSDTITNKGEIKYQQSQLDRFFGIFHDKRRASNKDDKLLIKEAVLKKFKQKK